MITLSERLKISPEIWERALSEFGNSLRVAIPGVIQSFNAETQTAVIQPAIIEVVNNAQDQIGSQPLPLLSDVPVVLPRAGGFTLTMPIKAGDECLVVFADMDIGAWFQSGGTANQQINRRRHDLSDAFAIIGCWSQPRVVQNYSTSTTQLRSDDGNTVVEVGSGEVTIKAGAVKAMGGGTVQKLVTDAFYQWFESNIIPFLQSKGYTGPNPPSNSETSIFQAQ
jgi:hypothetical protein